MRSFLGSGEAEISDQPRVLAYLETVFNQRYSKDAVGLRTSREMRTIAESIDALMEHTEVQGSGDFCYRRHLGTRSPSRADFRGRRFTHLSGGAAGHFAAGTPAAQSVKNRKSTARRLLGQYWRSVA